MNQLVRDAARSSPALAQPRLHHGRAAGPGPRHRRQHRDLQRGARHAARAAALPRSRAAGDRVWSKIQGNRNATAAGELPRLEEPEPPCFQELHAWSGGGVSLSTGRHPEQVAGQLTTPGLIGDDGPPRSSSAATSRRRRARSGKDKVVVLTHRLWERRLRGGPRTSWDKQVRVTASRTPWSACWRPAPPTASPDELYQPLSVQARADQPRLPLAARSWAA